MTPASFPSTTGTSRFGDRFGLASFVESLSSPTETPASGSAAAAAAALAAALVANVAHSAADPGTAAQADALQERLLQLAETDAEVLASARAALSARDPAQAGESAATSRSAQALASVPGAAGDRGELHGRRTARCGRAREVSCPTSRPR